jgi:Domain of unknown function (DUF4296)
MIKLFSYLLVILFLSCNNKNTVIEDVLPPQKMQAVFTDIVKADVFVSDFIKKDSAKNDTIESAILQQKIFALHKVSKKQFYDSYNYYINHRTVFKTMLDSMIVISNRERYNPKPMRPDTTLTQQ